jgi:transcriptional regulator with XRE-family HTH domain
LSLENLHNTINQRIKILISELRMSENEFAKQIKFPQTSLNAYTKRNSQPSVKLLEHIYSSYPSINLHWLITGEGSIWNDQFQESEGLYNVSTPNNELTKCEDRNKYLQDKVMSLEQELHELKKKNGSTKVKT